MNKVVEIETVAAAFACYRTVMIGGFLGTGTPERLVDALLAKGSSGLTLIANDTAFPGRGVGRLIAGRRVQRAIVSHIGTNPETGRQM